MARRSISAIARWWADDDPFRSASPATGSGRFTTSLHSTLLGNLLFSYALLGVGGLLMPSGPQNPIVRYAVVASLVVAVAWGGREFRSDPLPERASAALFAACDIFMVIVAAEFESLVLGLLSLTLLAPLALVIGYRHGARALTAHCILSGVAEIVLAVRVAATTTVDVTTVVVFLGTLLVLTVCMPISAHLILTRYRRRALDSHVDPLTQVFNRRGLLHHWRSLATDASSPACAVFCIDLDLFKDVNDTHGHGVGDLVLRRTARRIAANTDGLVARTGGEEFALIAPLSCLIQGRAEAADLAERVRAAISTGPDRVTVTASIGVWIADTAPVDGDFAETAYHLLSLADSQMYEAKRRGGDRVAVGSH